MQPDLYAYSLRNQESGWSWHVYDVEGSVIACGVEPSQTDAWIAVQEHVPGAREPLREAM